MMQLSVIPVPRPNISAMSAQQQLGLAKVLGDVVLSATKQTGALPQGVIDWLYTLDASILEGIIAISRDYASDIVGAVPIKDALRKPHVMLLGETGSGKSTLCKYLVSMASAACIAIDPHAMPQDWEGVFLIGAGMDYPIIGIAFEVLYALMRARYKLRAKGQSNFEPLIVMVDEFLAIADDEEVGKNCTKYFRKLIREARKVSIKIIILAQGQEVKALGIEGEGSLRDSMAVCYLSKFAIKQCKKESPENHQIMRTLEHPCMFDDTPAVLPMISDDLQFPKHNLPKDFVELWLAAKPPENPSNLLADSSASTPVDTLPVYVNGCQQVSTDVNENQMKASLVNYIEKHQSSLIKPRDIKQNIRAYRDAEIPLIKQHLTTLANVGYGRMIDDGLVTN
jgi:energy-coupling factor transporter ATP-binding protein EcfA2